MNVKTKLIDRLRPLMLGAVLLSGAAHAAMQPVDRVVAIVDNDVVMKSQLDQRVHEVQQTIAKRGGGKPPAGALEQQVLERLIVENLQLQIGERSGIRITDEELNQAVATIAQRNGMSPEQFRGETLIGAHGGNGEIHRSLAPVFHSAEERETSCCFRDFVMSRANVVFISGKCSQHLETNHLVRSGSLVNLHVNRVDIIIIVNIYKNSFFFRGKRGKEKIIEDANDDDQCANEQACNTFFIHYQKIFIFSRCKFSI